MQSISKSFESVLGVIVTSGFLVMIATVVWQVAARSPFLSSSPLWTNEVSIVLLVFITFLGGALADIRREQIEITYFKEILTDRIGYGFQVIIHVLIILFSAVTSLSAFFQMINNLGRASLNIPYFSEGFLYGFISVGLVIIGLSAAARVIRIFSEYEGETL